MICQSLRLRLRCSALDKQMLLRGTTLLFVLMLACSVTNQLHLSYKWLCKATNQSGSPVSEGDSAPMHTNAFEQADSYHRGDGKATTIGDKWQGQPGDGQNAHGHAKINHNMA